MGSSTNPEGSEPDTTWATILNGGGLAWYLHFESGADAQPGGNMAQKRQNQAVATQIRDYAMPFDFCKVFEHHMTLLYTLSFLLTGDHDKAEQCWVAALEDCVRCNRVFRESAQSWARHTVIKNAMRLIAPVRSITTIKIQEVPEPISDNTLIAITGLDAFARFVYVMSALEGFSDRECSVTLDCTVAEVVQARIQAMQQLAIAPTLTGDRLRRVFAR